MSHCFAICQAFETADHGLGVGPTTRTRTYKTANVSGLVAFKLTEKDDVVVEFVPGPKASLIWLHWTSNACVANSTDIRSTVIGTVSVVFAGAAAGAVVAAAELVL